jgi:hypothetical protein
MRGNFLVKYRRTRSDSRRGVSPVLITRKIYYEDHLYLVFDEDGTTFCSEQETVYLVNSEVILSCRGKELAKHEKLK